MVNGRVYVGGGEGESAPTYGFIFCLDANTGSVIWCFCTCRFAGGADNQPNRLPASVAAAWAGSHGFTVLPNPPETGCSVWSSCAYDSVHNAIFVGTGNSRVPTHRPAGRVLRQRPDLAERRDRHVPRVPPADRR